MTQTFSISANPQEAIHEWDRFLEAFQSQLNRPFDSKRYSQAAFKLLQIFGNSRFLAKWSSQYPERVEQILLDPYLEKEKPLTQFQEQIKQFADSGLDFLKSVHLFKYQELLRITLKDLAGGQEVIVLRELSALALTILQAVDQYLLKESISKWGVPLLKNGANCNYHILALGKLGGMELNYSSDIDLIAFYESDEGGADKLSLHEFFSRHLQSLTRALQEKTEDGFLYRVDWDLRPEGKAGTLVNSLAAMKQYYEVFGADWERQALTKALPASGSMELGERFIGAITPFVYRKYLDVNSIARIQVMKQKIHADLGKKTDKGFNVKLGIGGIREIEFFVQAFLLIYGGKQTQLRHTNTLAVLQRLADSQFVSQSEAKILRDSYLFLRKLENRLQMADEAQTHSLPHDPKEQIKAARRMGYADANGEAALNRFSSDLKTATTQVHRIFESLFSEKIAILIPAETGALSESEHPVKRLSSQLENQLEAQPDFERKLETIREFKAAQTEVIQKSEMNPSIPRREILLRLSILAESICQQALRLAQKELNPIFGEPLNLSELRGAPLPAELIIVGMGKLGGYEINYASDLDAIFIFSEHGETTGPKKITNAEYFARLVQKFISILGVATRRGAAYSVDTELRPSGHSGTLVTSLESFMDYQRTVSQIWERQSLLRARPIAGSPHLSRLVQEHLNALLYFKPHPPEIRTEMHRVRLRAEKEIAKEGPRSIDFKLGRGGIMDIEYILQYHQLCQAVEHEQLRVVNTFDGLDRLIELNLLPRSDDAVLLKEAYTFYRTLESKLAIRLKRGIRRLSTDAPIIEELASDLHLGAAKSFLEQYRAYADRVRAIYESIFVR